MSEKANKSANDHESASSSSGYTNKHRANKKKFQKGNYKFIKSTNGSKPKFKGAIAAIEDHIIYLGSPKQGNDCTKALDKIYDYCELKYDYGDKVVESIKSDKPYTFTEPAVREFPQNATEAQKEHIKMKMKKEYDMYEEKQDQYKKDFKKIYRVILGQCTQQVRNKLESLKDWDQIKGDPMKLVKAVKELTHSCQPNKYPGESLYYAIRSVFTLKQYDNEDDAEYAKRAKNAINVMILLLGGKPSFSHMAKQIVGYKDLDQAGKNAAEDHAFDQVMAYAYLRGADKMRSGKLIEDLANKYTLGDDKYPKSVAAAHELVGVYKDRTVRSINNKGSKSSGRTEGLAFVQRQDDKNKNNRYCYMCGPDATDHIASDPSCPKHNEWLAKKKKKKGHVHAQQEIDSEDDVDSDSDDDVDESSDDDADDSDDEQHNHVHFTVGHVHAQYEATVLNQQAVKAVASY